MHYRVSHKQFQLPIIVGLVIIALIYATTVLSSGLVTTLQNEHTPYAYIQLPVVENDARERLGLYGGIATAYNHRGNQESAIIVILPTGYIVPILGSGEIATFPDSYFAKENCEGNEYLPVSGPFPGLQPMRGIVYRSMSSNELNYVPRNKDSRLIQSSSRSSLEQDGTSVCKPSSKELRVLQVIHNAPEITGLVSESVFHLAKVALDNFTIRSQTLITPSDDKLLGSGDVADILDDAVNNQEECSPGCLVDALGNGSCDVECYVEACFYDQGDCNEVDSVKLQQVLSDMCSPGCFSADIGDSFCDPACNTQACQFDDGDCNQK